MPVTSEAYESAIKRSRELMKQIGVPSPRRPAGLEEDYEFPTDPAALSSNELGRKMLALMAWYGYSTKHLGVQDAELTTMNAVFNILIGKAMVDVQKSSPIKMVKDQLFAASLDRDPDLLDFYQRMLQKQTFADTLRAQVQVYEKQWSALSREQSRRSEDHRPGA